MADRRSPDQSLDEASSLASHRRVEMPGVILAFDHVGRISNLLGLAAVTLQANLVT
jgi:hypothetical protein